MDGTIEREVGVVDVVTVIADVAVVVSHWERHGRSRKKRLWHSIHVVARVLLYEKDLKEARGISQSQNVSLDWSIQRPYHRKQRVTSMDIRVQGSRHRCRHVRRGK